jgi:protein-S-isoprenylcysteine O-methyltransferase Ste14
MFPVFALLYGLASYAVFLGTFLYAIGFVTGLVVPKTIDVGSVVGFTPLGETLLINLALLSVFAIQHSVMARKPFKRWFTRFIPATIERSTYVLLASLALMLVLWQWRPIPTIVWEVGGPAGTALLALSLLGFGVVLLSTFLINHFELFGLQQVVLNLVGRDAVEQKFRTPFLYKTVRHPLYLGFVIAFWAAPVMTAGHLLFSVVTTGYILVGIAFEERDMIEAFGDEYRRYRQQVAALIPFWGKSS